jgi:hypothetical protein
LFVNLFRVRSIAGVLAIPFGIAVLLGSHTFAATVVEAYPINTFMTVVVSCLAAVNLSFGRRAVWRDVMAVVVFALVLFTVETGVLVWLILVAGYLLGWRGVSKWGLLATTLVLCAYAYLRLSLPLASAPSLAIQTHDSGFGFRVLTPAEQLAMFGDRAWVLYGYNVLCQVLTVLFAEPKNGVWIATQRLLAGELLPRDVIAVVSSTGATALIVWYATRRISDWRRAVVTDGDRLVLLFVPILGANAVLSYSYLKDVLVSPAGVFHAAAATVAFTLCPRAPRAPAARAAGVRGHRGAAPPVRGMDDAACRNPLLPPREGLRCPKRVDVAGARAGTPRPRLEPRRPAADSTAVLRGRRHARRRGALLDRPRRVEVLRDPVVRVTPLVAVAPLLVAFVASAAIAFGAVVGAKPFWPDPPLNVAEAAGLGNAGEVVRLITAEGQDPNRAWPIRAGIFSSNDLTMTPLEAAMVIRREALVPVLLRHGAVVPESGPARTALICRALSFEATLIAEMLVNMGDRSDPRSSCPPPPTD